MTMNKEFTTYANKTDSCHCLQVSNKFVQFLTLAVLFTNAQYNLYLYMTLCHKNLFSRLGYQNIKGTGCL